MGEIPDNMPKYPLDNNKEITPELELAALDYMFNKFIETNSGPNDQYRQDILKGVIKNFLARVSKLYNAKKYMENIGRKGFEKKIDEITFSNDLDLLLDEIRKAYINRIDSTKR